jgi:peroxin-14
MATVVGGLGYAACWTAKRYVYPLIAPPTPPQLEQDKAQVDEAFAKAFDLLEQLSKDTTELKEAENARKERLDAALAEVESVIGKMKEANESRELDSKRFTRELAEIREQIPKAIEKEKELVDQRLGEVGNEMRSLKTLVGNRMGQPVQPMQQQRQQTPSISSSSSAAGSGSGSIPAPQAQLQTNGVNGAQPQIEHSAQQANGTPAQQDGEKPARSGLTTLGFGGRPKSAIPDWQRAAKQRNDEAKAAGSNRYGGSSTPGTPGTPFMPPPAQSQQQDGAEGATGAEGGAAS